MRTVVYNRAGGKEEMQKDRLKIGTKELTSRIVMPPIATYQSTEEGYVTPGMLDYYGERAANPNVSMIITEHSYIDLGGKAKAKQLSIEKEADMEGLSRLTDVIHRNGALAMAQLNHAGSAAPSEVTGIKPVSASSVILPVSPMMGDGKEPEELSEDQIAEIISRFASAADRAKRAGYDGVEIHSAHAYLLNQFYSPLTNLRQDRYGGSLENRLNIHREVIRAVRDTIGRDLILSIRLGGCDYTEGGSTIEDSVHAAEVFEESGADMIDLSGGMCRYTRKGHTEPGYFQDMSSAIKKAVSVPVMLTGGVKTLQDAYLLLEKGAADLIGVGRELLKNPRWEA